MKIFPIIKRVKKVTVSSGAVNVNPPMKVGVKMTPIIKTFVQRSLGLGVKMSQSPSRLLSKTGLGVSMTHKVTGAPAKRTTGIGLSMTNKVNGSPNKPVGVIAQGIVATMISLTRTYGAVTATNEGPDNWTNPTNAQGVHNATLATRAGQALAATNAPLKLHAYPDGGAGKAMFTIDSCILNYYVKQAGTVLNNGSVALQARKGSSGAWSTATTITSDFDSTGTPLEINIWASGFVTSWADIDSLEVRVLVVLATATPLVTVSLDAVELIVTGRTRRMKDESPAAGHGTIKGTPVGTIYPSPVSGWGGAFGGDGVDRNDDSMGVEFSHLPANGVFALECAWKHLTIPVSGNGEVLAGRINDFNTGGDFGLYVYPGGYLVGFCIRADGTAISCFSGAGDIVAGTVYKAKLNYDGANLRLFLDGVLKDTQAVAGGLLAVTTTAPFWVGRHRFEVSQATSPASAKALIDEVRLSSVTRGTTGYTPSSSPFTSDADTRLLCHFDEYY